MTISRNPPPTPEDRMVDMLSLIAILKRVACEIDEPSLIQDVDRWIEWCQWSLAKKE